MLVAPERRMSSCVMTKDRRRTPNNFYRLFGRRSNFNIPKLLQTQLLELTWLFLVASGSVGATFLNRSDKKQQCQHYPLNRMALNRSPPGQPNVLEHPRMLRAAFRTGVERNIRLFMGGISPQILEKK